MSAPGEVPGETAIAVVCDGNRLACGAYVPARPRGTVIVVHGIPSVAPADPDDEGYPGLARGFAARGWTSIWVDMRGARRSAGDFSIEGWVRDLRATVDAAYAMDGAAALPLAIVGSSAGGAVAVEVAARGAPVAALVLLAAPAAWVSFAGSAAEAVRKITQDAGMPLSAGVLADPGAWAAEFESVTTEHSIAGVDAPVLVVHGTDDDVVPVDHAARIARRAPDAEVRIIEGAPHQLRRDPGVFELVAGWLERRLT